MTPLAGPTASGSFQSFSDAVPTGGAVSDDTVDAVGSLRARQLVETRIPILTHAVVAGQHSKRLHTAHCTIY